MVWRVPHSSGGELGCERGGWHAAPPHQWPLNLQLDHTDHSGSGVTLFTHHTNRQLKEKKLEKKLSDTLRQAISDAGGLHGAACLAKM